MAEASGIMMQTYTTLIPSFSPTIHRTQTHHLGLSQLTVSRRHQFHFSVSATANGATQSPTTSVVMETIPWGCENDSLETASSLQSWLSESGLPPQKMGIDKVDVGERGLVALKNIRKGEKLLFVPPSLVITPDSEWSCPEAGEVLKRNSVPDWPLLATYLISEASLMKSSRWCNYISALPRQPYSLLYW